MHNNAFTAFLDESERSPIERFGFGIKSFFYLLRVTIVTFFMFNIVYLPVGLSFGSWDALTKEGFLTTFTLGNMG